MTIITNHHERRIWPSTSRSATCWNTSTAARPRSSWCAFDDAADGRAPLSAATRLYGQGGPVDAFQVVWPDPNHKFPWDPNFDGEMRARQPLLGRRATPGGPPS